MNYYIYINKENITANHRLAAEEYIKRLSAYCNVMLNTSTGIPFSKESVKSGRSILIVDRGMSTYSSDEFSQYIERKQLSGISTIIVTIGYRKSDILSYLQNSSHNENNNNLSISYDNNLPGIIDNISISAANLSVQTTTVLFLEQLYRGYTIIQGKTYHK